MTDDARPASFAPGPRAEDWFPAFTRLEVLAGNAERLARSFDARAQALADIDATQTRPLRAEAARQRETALILRWVAARASRLHELTVAERRPSRYGGGKPASLATIKGGKA